MKNPEPKLQSLIIESNLFFAILDNSGEGVKK